jgi:hypothetical protein
MIARELNLNHTTVHQILTEELAMKKLCALIVPKNLTITTTPSHDDLRDRMFYRKENSCGSTAPILPWSESVRLLFESFTLKGVILGR